MAGPAKPSKIEPRTEPRTPEDLEAEIAQLREDIAALAKQLQATGEHSYSTAKRAAAEGVEQLNTVRANARDMEAQLIASVREKPVTSLAIAAGAGFLFALLSRR